MLCHKGQNAQCPDGMLPERGEFLHARIKPCHVGVAVDGDAPLNEFRDGRRMIPMTVRYETSVNAACPKTAPDLDTLEWDSCVKEEAGPPIPDEVGVPAAPRREYLDVHD